MNNKNWAKILSNLALISQIGIDMMIPIFGGLWLGNFLDVKLNTSPLFLFICIVIGISVAFYNVYRLIFSMTKRRK